MTKLLKALVPASMALALIAPQAHAASPSPDQTRIIVRYSDLDLVQPDGMHALRRRVEAAARQVCGPAPSDTLTYVMQYRSCVRSTADRAMAGLNERTASNQKHQMASR